MAFPDKPVVVDLDQIGLDDWITFTEAQGLMQAASGPMDLARLGEVLRTAKAILVTFLATGGWTADEVGKLNLGEMKQVMSMIGTATAGPNSLSGPGSTPPSGTGGSSRSRPASAKSRKNGVVPHGTLHHSSA